MAVVWLMIVSVGRASTLEEVRKRGMVQCGVSTGLPGFSTPDEQGDWTGLDVDVCRAVAAAVFGDKNKVKFIPLTPQERFTALQSGHIDILSGDTPWTITNDTSLALNFAGISYYDGQGFLVSKKLGIKKIQGLNGAPICVQPGTTAESNLNNYFHNHHMTYKKVPESSSDHMIKDLNTGICVILTGKQSHLYGLRTKLAHPENTDVLSETISKRPLGPVVRQGDDGWFNIVKWSLFAVIDAEELGVTSTNVDDMKKSADPDIKRLLGAEGIKGKGLGLVDTWAYMIIKQVGNYGEIYERNLGRNSLLKIPRGTNELWNKGGLQYAPPMR